MSADVTVSQIWIVSSWSNIWSWSAASALPARTRRGRAFHKRHFLWHISSGPGPNHPPPEFPRWTPQTPPTDTCHERYANSALLIRLVVCSYGCGRAVIHDRVQHGHRFRSATNYPDRKTANWLSISAPTNLDAINGQHPSPLNLNIEVNKITEDPRGGLHQIVLEFREIWIFREQLFEW